MDREQLHAVRLFSATFSSSSPAKLNPNDMRPVAEITVSKSGDNRCKTSLSVLKIKWRGQQYRLWSLLVSQVAIKNGAKTCCLKLHVCQAASAKHTVFCFTAQRMLLDGNTVSLVLASYDCVRLLSLPTVHLFGPKELLGSSTAFKNVCLQVVYFCETPENTF